MYEHFYGFKKKPFQLLPNPDFLFRSKKHDIALTYLEYGIYDRAGFIVITGEVGTGKTTLLEKVIARLKERGYRVGAIKHDAHRFDIDHPGKDSHRLASAGADTTLIFSPQKLALVKKHAAPPPLTELLATYFADVDIVLTEGLKKGSLPKIELHRQARSATLICRGAENDPTLLAVASNEPLKLDVPVLDYPLLLTDAAAVGVSTRYHCL